MNPISNLFEWLKKKFSIGTFNSDKRLYITGEINVILIYLFDLVFP
jgi:hypothetical protein